MKPTKGAIEPIKGIREFIEEIRTNPNLAEKFAKAVQKVAKQDGFEITEQDVLSNLIDTKPVTRPLPQDTGYQRTTLALGEEATSPGKITTRAIGEENTGLPPKPGK